MPAMPTVVLTGATRGIGRRPRSRSRGAAPRWGRRPRRPSGCGRRPGSCRSRGGAGPGARRRHGADERGPPARRRAARDASADRRARQQRRRPVHLATPHRGRASSRPSRSTTSRRSCSRACCSMRLNDSAARVVTTASDAHIAGRLELDDLQSERRPLPSRPRYGTSKLCNVLFTRELQRREPGARRQLLPPRGDPHRLRQERRHAGTDRITRPRRSWVPRRAAHVRWSGWRSTPRPGSRRVRGEGKAVQPSARAEDDRLAAALWERSEELTGARRPERRAPPPLARARAR